MAISRTSIDNKLWEVRKYLMNKYGMTRASIIIDPLAWYINTGRASVEFLHAFLDAKSFMTARRLAKARTYEMAIANLKTLYNI